MIEATIGKMHTTFPGGAPRKHAVFEVVVRARTGLYVDPRPEVARELIAEGYDENEEITFLRDGKDSMRITTLGEWAKWSFREWDTESVKKRKYVPRPK